MHPSMLGWRVSRSQTAVKAGGSSISIQQGSLQYQLNTGQRTKLPGVRCVNLQVCVKRSSLEMESPSGPKLLLTSSRQTTPTSPEHAMAPSPQRHPKFGPPEHSIEFVLSPTAWRDGTSSDPGASHPSPSCWVKLLCSPRNQKAPTACGASHPQARAASRRCPALLFAG